MYVLLDMLCYLTLESLTENQSIYPQSEISQIQKKNKYQEKIIAEEPWNRQFLELREACESVMLTTGHSGTTLWIYRVFIRY